MTIAVLMSTYNGERYLKDQIDSIISQKLQEGDELYLYIRDDGSTDNTINIIREYAHNYNNVFLININGNKNIGVKDSFLTLLNYTFHIDKKIDFFAFSDQDDVWLEDKLIKGIEKIINSVNEKGALYYSNKFIVDENFKHKKRESIIYYGDFIEVLWSSLASGCTMIFNRKMAERAIEFYPYRHKYHDAWIYRLAKCIGADVFFDENPYIYYRQHLGNTLGEDACKPHNNIFYMAGNFIPNLLRPREHLHQSQIKEIADYYSDYIDNSIAVYIKSIVNYNKSFKEKIRLLFVPEMRKRPILTQLVWAYKVIFNMI